MITYIVLPTLVIYVIVLGIALVHMERHSSNEIKANMTRLASNYAARFDDAFRNAATIADTTARFMEITPNITEKQIYELLSANVTQDPAIYGAAMAFAPNTDNKGDQGNLDKNLFCPYVYRKGDALTQMNITRDVLDWYSDPRWEWWSIPKRTGKSTWTKPYFDEGAGNVLMVTYSAPFFRDGKLLGVTTVDIKLPTLKKNIGREIIGDVDFVILTSAGQYVFSPKSELIMNRTIFDVAKEKNDKKLLAVSKKIVSGKPGVQIVSGWTSPDEQWIFYAPIKSTNWAFAAHIPEDQALMGVRKRVFVAMLALLGTLVLIIVSIYYVSGRITSPIAKLRSKVQELAAGDLNTQIKDIKSKDEIGELAVSFNQMSKNLRTHVEQLAVRSYELMLTQDVTIMSLSTLAEARDPETGAHIARTRNYVKVLAEHLVDHPRFKEFLGTENIIDMLYRSAPLHDIGKVGTKDNILLKAGKLTAEEFEEIKEHPTIGGDALRWAEHRLGSDSFLKYAREIAYSHHERWDGTGYPSGLGGDDIPISARLMALADVYDALTSKRGYKPAWPLDKSRDCIVEGKGTHFDPDVVDAFLAAEEEFKEIAAGKVDPMV